MPNNRLKLSMLKPTEVVKVVNSTPLGTVIGSSQVYRHFEQGGFRIASNDDERCINLAKYCAWLFDQLENATANAVGMRSYAERREAARQALMEQSLAGRDIGELPPVENPERKEACRLNFKLFCETYFPEVYALEWSEDHLRAIAKIEKSVLKGGLFALAMSRGSGKSSLTETAAIWAMCYGHREFVVVVGASESAALEILDSIKTELEVNEHLAADFPEVCYPIAALDGIANRCAGQLYKGERTRITWTSNEIILPTIRGAASSGVLVRVAGITGRIRGMKYKKPDGRTIRPEFVIVDDPQTTESAGSIEQTRKRVRVLAGDILGLAGPGKKISGIMPCTVIRPGDMAEQILDKSKHPEWNGERCKMLYQFPKNEELWNRYADLRADELREKGTFEKATQFYAEHRAEMDEGAVVSWPARHNYDELSAIQHAMNLKLTDEAAFFAEYQNDPLPEDLGTEEQLTVDGIVNKLNGHSCRGVPVSANHLTMFIDVQKSLLFYVVCAWDDDFTGYLIDYGTWPDQRRRYFSLADANPTLQSKFPHTGLEGCLYGGLKALTEDYLAREFTRDDGAAMRIERCLIDANWGQTTEVVYQFCREAQFANVILPSHGKYIGASSKPMSEFKKSVGDRVGHNWRMPNIRGKRVVRHVIYDTNYWKSFVASRLLTSMGDRGCLSLWGREAERHMLFAEHVTAEYRVKTEGRGRRVDEWKMLEAASVAWKPLGWDCAFVSEIEKFPAAVLAERFPNVPNLGDFTKIQTGDYKGDIDLLVGGTPCQAFSIAGLRKGLKDERGNLALEFTRLAFRTNARWLVWENVPGVLSSGKGRDFATFLSLLVGWEVPAPGGKWKKAGLVTAAHGCFNVGWRVLDAQYTRVQQFPRAIPQRRKRVLLVGSLGSWADCAKVLFDGEMCGGNLPPRREAGQGSPAGAESRARSDARLCWWDGSQKADTLTTRSIGQMMPDKQQLPCIVDTRFQDAYEPQVAPSLLASDYKEPKAVVGSCCPTLDASYPGKMNNQDVDKLVCYENHGQDSRIRDCGDVAPSIPAQAGTGGNNLPLVQRVFVMDSMGSNAMKSANPKSGIRETDVAQTLDTTAPSPSKNQGGMAVVEAVAIAENVIGRSDKAGGNGVGAKSGVCYTFDTAGVHGVCYPIDVMNIDGRDLKAKCYGEDGESAYSLTNRRPSGVCIPGIIRKLVPVECERLMGFPDFWTKIPWRGKPADECPDGLRYKALGNSMCTNVMAWIGERIDAVEKEKANG